MTRALVLGNPNCGKTTVFNALTGNNQRVGNWPGVTVDKKTGFLSHQGISIELIDLPGVYSLSLTSSANIDEKITANAVLNEHTDIIVNVLDASQLERNLFLTTQLLELQIPMIVVLNMADIAKSCGAIIDVEGLSQRLNCPVIIMEAHRNEGINELSDALVAKKLQIPATLTLDLSRDLQFSIDSLHAKLKAIYPQKYHYCACRIFEGDVTVNQEFCIKDDSDIIIADARYGAIHRLVGAVQKRNDVKEQISAKIDRVVLNRFWALPIFFLVMYLMFLFAVNLGGVFQQFFDLSSEVIFVDGFASVLHNINLPQWLIVPLAYGLGKGINVTLSFIPIIAAMFFFLALLETTGYMSRAAFVIDKAMRALGLPGKSFVPMIIGFGCNVPAVMASRSAGSSHDRLLTAMMAPFASCSARLAIYTVFVATFFPVGGHNVVFSLYVMGILMAVLTGFILRKFMSLAKASPLIIELPTYHAPSFKRLMRETMLRLRFFIKRASKIIIPVCVLLSCLNGVSNGASILAIVSQKLTYIFAPMGIHTDNWPAVVGLATGVVAKEVVIGTLSTLYAGHVVSSFDAFNFWLALKEAALSIPVNLAHLPEALLNPLAASAPVHTWSKRAAEAMYYHFDGKVGAYAYLLFVLLYVPCVSTMAVLRQEVGQRLMWFSVIWSLMLAYTVAVSFYQFATLWAHPVNSIKCLLLIILVMTFMLLLSKRWFQSFRRQYVIENM